MKKFEIGISSKLSVEDYKELFAKYGSYIDYIYFSPPLGIQYQTRQQLYERYSTEGATEYLKNIIKLAKEHRIKTELCLNMYWLRDEEILLAKTYVNDKLGIEPDAIVLLDEYREKVLEYFPNSYYIYSFNNGIRGINDIKNISNDYDEIILKPLYTNNYLLWEEAKKKGFNVRILLNNGCTPNCLTCRQSRKCKEIFDANTERNGYDYTFATQTVLPVEVHSILENNINVDSYKISSRVSPKEEFFRIMELYTNNIEFDMKDWHCVCQLRQFRNIIDSVNIDNVYKIKEKFWGTKLI